ncbi:MAG: RlmE family RNA methyltransferase [Pseudomonadota bacterium]|nr:rRNA methyltransferase [Alphaproteobacteria bacterium]MCS5597113.1 RlmE family RNA methyltransferase [Alphaproteobacteria bacterium]MEC7577512.1 RlmE family RNA methyltransferase [Pseudomonadota bacterium]MEC7703241.1 RlmE family RNA methyltransferase [Pseudomonadota bacterium]MEC9236569.1 RlmE family RNA methyltransferase [Pseudomonadota bacterium]|tara:strand:+ start:355215 stop:355919 length:705 start_codon:yes stop_codon:yes gene_type:complete
MTKKRDFSTKRNKKRTARNSAEHVKTAKGRKSSSTRWLKRQLNDKYVHEAQRLGYRGRAAFKIKEIDERFKIFKPDSTVVDLGAAPGGWCQVALQRGVKKVVAIDLLPVESLGGLVSFEMDFMDDDAPDVLLGALEGVRPNVVMSDMAHNTVGHKNTDHLKIMALVEAGYYFARDILEEKGTFIAKVFQGGASNDLLALAKREFETVRHFKPPSSRKESSETYLIATGFRGKKD